MTEEAVGRRRSSFGPVAGGGLLTAGLTAYAAHQAWASTSGREPLAVAVAGLGEVPLAGALALVALAGWGVLLVTRGRVRRAFAVLTALAATGTVVAAAIGVAGVRESVERQLRDLGVVATASWTVWPWVTLGSGAVAVVLALVAVRAAPGWPEMGRRYDAPHDAAPTGDGAADPARADERDLWRALDEGHDPTEGP